MPLLQRRGANGSRRTIRPMVIGLVGCGRWGSKILRDLRALGAQVQVVARSPESVERAELGGADRIVDRVEALTGADGVVVATPTSTHAAVLDEVLALGVPVYVEKPMTVDPESAERLAREAGDRLFVMDKWRHHPGIEALGEIARSGELGETVGVQCVRESWGSPHRDVDSVWIHLPHDLAIGLEILGELPPAAAAVAEVTGGWASGMQALLGQHPWLSISHTANAPEHRRHARLSGENGSAWLAGGFEDHIVVAHGHPGEAELVRRPIEADWPLLRELRSFVEHLRGGAPPRSSAAEGAAIVQRVAELRALAGLATSGEAGA
ncbi:MAG TPA: Gfo/Idh/MocA family oxidoreductase [Thermoleophilaceae bacterium]|nr:Gfo/Idh/MocA family oxidoreductase [Thermoleophilaceae bacterium]